MADTPKHTRLRKPPEEKQSKKFTVRVTPAEFEEIHEKAASASLGVREFCRRSMGEIKGALVAKSSQKKPAKKKK